MTVEVLTAILVALVGLVSAAMLILGVGASIGVLRFGRCERCEHLAVASGGAPLHTCAYCEHQRLMHPLATLHHHPARTAAPRNP